MNDGEQFVDRCRQLARRLHQDLAAPPPVAHAAAARFAQLPAFRDADPAELTNRRRGLRHAAQDVVAFEHGFVSWGELLRGSLPLFACVTVHCSAMTAFVNRWFADYAEAARSLHCEGGYLLPHRTQFFVTVAGAVRELGLDPEDPDWRRIGFDWVRPRDPEAHLRLCRARFDAMVARGEAFP
ncbi:MAG: hypothetical protein WAT39_05620 [Planctomycetota bacterium]